MLFSMATKRTKKTNGDAHDDAVVTELRRIYEETRAQGIRTDALTAEVRANGTELRAVRELLVTAVANDRRRIDILEVRVSALEAGKH